MEDAAACCHLAPPCLLTSSPLPGHETSTPVQQVRQLSRLHSHAPVLDSVEAALGLLLRSVSASNLSFKQQAGPRLLLEACGLGQLTECQVS